MSENVLKRRLPFECSNFQWNCVRPNQFLMIIQSIRVGCHTMQVTSSTNEWTGTLLLTASFSFSSTTARSEYWWSNYKLMITAIIAEIIRVHAYIMLGESHQVSYRKTTFNANLSPQSLSWWRSYFCYGNSP